MTFNICFRHLVLLEMIFIERIFKKVAQEFVIQCKVLPASYSNFCVLLPTSYLN